MKIVFFKYRNKRPPRIKTVKSHKVTSENTNLFKRIGERIKNIFAHNF